MNLHGLAASMISSVNPLIDVTVKISTGQGPTAPNGVRPPAYDTYAGIQAQVQPLSSQELRQLDGLNLGGNRNGIYLNGGVAGLVRATGQGGDIVITPDNLVWLVVLVFEQWPDWCHAAIQLQNGR